MSSEKNCEEQLAGLTGWLLKQHTKGEVMSMTRGEEAIEESAKTILGRHSSLPVFRGYLTSIVSCTTEAAYLSVVREALKAARWHYEPKVDDSPVMNLNSVAVMA